LVWRENWTDRVVDKVEAEAGRGAGIALVVEKLKGGNADATTVLGCQTIKKRVQ
jgi:hypothetical protein